MIEKETNGEEFALFPSSRLSPAVLPWRHPPLVFLAAAATPLDLRRGDAIESQPRPAELFHPCAVRLRRLDRRSRQQQLPADGIQGQLPTLWVELHRSHPKREVH